jgi:hypothetical protein
VGVSILLFPIIIECHGRKPVDIYLRTPSKFLAFFPGEPTASFSARTLKIRKVFAELEVRRRVRVTGDSMTKKHNVILPS